jgi:glycosyltransferase involved in cell wall biosynthesis
VPHRPRILAFNQYYAPGVESTAVLLSELTSALADEFDVTVITGVLQNVPNRPGRYEHLGVDVIRVSSTAFDRSLLSRRALNYLTYMVQALRFGLQFSPRPDVVFCMTDPPMVADVALAIARRFDAPLVVVSQDIFPEVAVELRRMENRFLVALLKVLVGFYLRRSDRVVAIGETMRRRLIAKGTPPDRITVIPNWVDTTSVVPQPKDNPWSREAGLAEGFVVAHSGNIGHAQDLDSLIRAATFLRDLSDLKIAIIGSGARYGELVDLAERLEADSVTFLPYQPREVLSMSLSAADIHVVGLASGLAGYVVPSRLYGIMAAGRPVVVAADENSETAQLVAEIGCGVVVRPGRPDLLAEVIRRAHAGEFDLEEMGRLGRAHAMRTSDRTIAIDSYRQLLRGAAAGATC